LVAAASGPVEAELLAVVSELPDADLLAALRAAVADQVLVPDPATETYAFRHALTQEALYAELLPGERARLHARFARALTENPELAAGGRRAGAARLAYHWVRAHEPGLALPVSVQAGLQSVAAYAFADAQRQFETALELWDQVADAEAGVDRDRAGVLQLAAESAYLAGDPNRAITLTRAALKEVDAVHNPARAGVLHGRLGGYLHATGGEGALEQYEAAVRLVPASPPLAERAQVLAAFGEALMGQGHYRESRELCDEAVVIAREVGALAEEGDARRVLGVDLAFLGNLEAGVEQLNQARRIAHVVGRVDDLARAFAVLSGLLEAFGESEEAAAVAAEGAEQAAKQGLRRWHSPFLTATAARAMFALGRWDDADVLLQRAADGMAPELAAMRVFIETVRAELDVARGLTEAAARHLAAARDAYALTITQPWIVGPLFAATAELAIVEGRLADAGAAVAEGLRLCGADVVFAAHLYALGLRTAADRAELARARRLGDEVDEACRVGTALAAELHARMSLERGDGRVPTPRTEAQVVLCDAELARLGGDSDPDLWAASAAAWERLAQPHPAAYARRRAAETLLLRGVRREEVEVSLREAHATASRLGAGPLRTEIEALARRGRLDLAAGPTPAAPRPPSSLDRLGLTSREQEVLGLVALGRTNRQIAQALFISPKTATVHVSNILAKLGVRSRVEAATIAHRLGIVRPRP
jgi:DNA-binding CsgD family transcriptional regulator/tetratricopeptide (TPR) repeat protein